MILIGSNISNPNIITVVLVENSPLCTEVSLSLGFVISGGVDVTKVVTLCDLIRVVYVMVESNFRRVVVLCVNRGCITGGVVA